MKKAIKKIILNMAIAIALLLGLLLTSSSFHWNVKDYNVMIFQFGKVVDIKKAEGIYLTVPFIQSSKAIFVGDRLYDLPTTSVITLDKKSMICNAYVTWRIHDTKLYYQKLNSADTAQSRIDTAVYSAIKNIISCKTQDEIITGKDGSLGKTILDKINIQDYGITITNLEIKALDLPDENKEAIYERMISERNTITAQYTANGEKNYTTQKASVDSQVRQIQSNAEADAAQIIAEGEEEYYKILANSYSKSEEKTEFYKYCISLDALEKSLKNGGTYIINEKSPLYEILSNSSKTTTLN